MYFCECCGVRLEAPDIFLAHLDGAAHGEQKRRWVADNRGFYFLGWYKFWSACQDTPDKLRVWKERTRQRLGLIPPSRRRDWLLLPTKAQTRHRLRHCFTKLCYRSEAEAVAHMPQGAGLLNPYLCDYGQHYHLGHLHKHTLRTWSQAKRMAG